MKKLIFTLLTTVLTISFCFSQDVISKKTGEDISSKVIEITPTEIKYKNFEHQTGPTYSILKSDVLLIRYENGSKDIFNEEAKKVNVSYTAPSGENLYEQGQRDASKYYKKYKAAGTGTLVTGLISPLVGLIPAITCSSTPPKDTNLNYPNPELMNNHDYFDGYTKKAKKIKQGRVWKNWGIAFGVNLVAVIILTAGQQ